MENPVLTSGVPKKYVKIRPVIINGERKISIKADISYLYPSVLNQLRKRRLVDVGVGTDSPPKLPKVDGEESTGTSSNMTPKYKTFPSKGQMLMQDIEKFTRFMENVSKEESFESRIKEEAHRKKTEMLMPDLKQQETKRNLEMETVVVTNIKSQTLPEKMEDKCSGEFQNQANMEIVSNESGGVEHKTTSEDRNMEVDIPQSSVSHPEELSQNLVISENFPSNDLSSERKTEGQEISSASVKVSSPSVIVKEDTDPIVQKEESCKSTAKEKEVSETVVENMEVQSKTGEEGITSTITTQQVIIFTDISTDSEVQEKIVATTGKEQQAIGRASEVKATASTDEEKTVANTDEGKMIDCTREEKSFPLSTSGKSSIGSINQHDRPLNVPEKVTESIDETQLSSINTIKEKDNILPSSAVKENASSGTVVREKILAVSCDENICNSISLGQKTPCGSSIKNKDLHLITEKHKISQSVDVDGNKILKPETNKVFETIDRTLVLGESLVQSDSKQEKGAVDTQNVSASGEMKTQEIGVLTSVRDNLIKEVRALARIRRSQIEEFKRVEQLKERIIKNTERAKLSMLVESAKCEESKHPSTLEVQIKALTVMKPKFLEELFTGYKELCRIATNQINKVSKGAEFLTRRNNRHLEDAMARRYEELMKKKLLVALPEEEFQNYPMMSRQMLGAIDKALQTHGPNDILVEFQSLRISRESLGCLIGLNWLNDDVINMYMELIMDRSRKRPHLPSSYAFNTFFLPKIMSAGQASVRRWTRKVDIFSFDVIAVPCHLGIHWCMAIIDFRDKAIRYYDSVGNPNNQALQAIYQYLCDEHLDKKKQPFNGENWRLINVQGSPQQQNGSDCGVFSCITAEHICRDSNLTFSQKNIPYFRSKMIYEILTRQLIT